METGSVLKLGSTKCLSRSPKPKTVVKAKHLRRFQSSIDSSLFRLAVFLFLLVGFSVGSKAAVFCFSLNLVLTLTSQSLFLFEFSVHVSAVLRNEEELHVHMFIFAYF